MIKSEQTTLQQAPLGKVSTYVSEYTPNVLFPLARKSKRDEIGVSDVLPFYGHDMWHGYEISWLNPKGKPQVAIMQCRIACESINIIESKSFKLYVNSFNNTKFCSKEAVQQCMQQDLMDAAQGDVAVVLSALDELRDETFALLPGECLDDLDVACDTYTVTPEYLICDGNEQVCEDLHSHLLKSNCLVTGQPDWGSILIRYQGNKIDRAGLLRYIVSFRNHNEFHEQCVERIFMDVMQRCQPQQLTVEARYTRRGGLDINPIRSTNKLVSYNRRRLVRQ